MQLSMKVVVSNDNILIAQADGDIKAQLKINGAGKKHEVGDVLVLSLTAENKPASIEPAPAEPSSSTPPLELASSTPHESGTKPPRSRGRV